MVINISNCKLLCGVSSDGGMFLNMKIYNEINICDVVAVDGGYT